MSRYDLTDFEWRVIEPLLPNKPRGVPRVDDRRVLNGLGASDTDAEALNLLVGQFEGRLCDGDGCANHLQQKACRQGPD